MNNQLEELKNSIYECRDYLVGVANTIIEDIRKESQVEDIMNSIINFTKVISIFQEGNIAYFKNTGYKIFELNQLNEHLNDINASLINKDYFLIADLFEYEIIPCFEIES